MYDHNQHFFSDNDDHPYSDSQDNFINDEQEEPVQEDSTSEEEGEDGYSRGVKRMKQRLATIHEAASELKNEAKTIERLLEARREIFKRTNGSLAISSRNDGCACPAMMMNAILCPTQWPLALIEPATSRSPRMPRKRLRSIRMLARRIGMKKRRRRIFDLVAFAGSLTIRRGHCSATAATTHITCGVLVYLLFPKVTGFCQRCNTKDEDEEGLDCASEQRDNSWVPEDQELWDTIFAICTTVDLSTLTLRMVSHSFMIYIS